MTGIEILDSLHIEVADAQDADAIADLIRRAFHSQAELYAEESLPPLSETAASVRDAMARGVVLKAMLEGRIVGSVRGISDGETCEVGRLVVEPDLQGHGIGRALTRRLERLFPEVERFEIFTGHLSEGPLHLYETLGYARTRTERIRDGLELVFLEKRSR